MGSIGTLIAVIKVPFSLEFYKFEQIIIVWCVGAVTADLLITTTLVYYLVSCVLHYIPSLLLTYFC